jgi:S1-C subfamily serine protease
MARADVPLGSRFNHIFREAWTPIGRLNRQKERAIEKTLPSTVTFITKGPAQNGEIKMEIGSGFAVASIPSTKKRPGEVLLATNTHVIQTYATDTQGLFTLEVVTSGAQGGIRNEELKQTFTQAEVVHISDKHDLALVRLSLAEHPEVNMPALKLGHSSLLDAPDTLLSIGAPLGTEDTVTEVHVSKNNLTRECSEEGCDMYMQISLTNPGMSGGALIDPLYAGLIADPVVVGMPTLGAQDNPTQGYMLPAEAIREELDIFEAKLRAALGGRRTAMAA